tara:strand:+ start:1312 stop:1968 length:657 start_codon:yes stop_codon:yes gene_type:complete
MVKDSHNWVLKHGDFDSLATKDKKDIFILDTGTIIDFEDNYRANHNEADHPVKILERIEHPLIITEQVLGELNNHNKYTKIQQGKNLVPIVSDSTITLLRKLHEESVDLIKASGIEYLDIDHYGYHTYLAAGHAFKEDYRKGVKDVVSNADRDLVSKAFLLSQAKYYGMPIAQVHLLSPDDHIIKTAEVLKSHNNFKEHGVKPIHTRNQIKKHLNLKK